MAASLWVGEVDHNWEGSRIKPEAQVRGAQLQLASRKGETYWKDTVDLGLQSFAASGSLLMSQFFTSGGQTRGASASASVFPVTIQG